VSAGSENKGPQREDLSLNDAATHVLEECRTVVPGMQALFGFQLIAVFSNVFWERVTPEERLMHLGAIVLVTIAIALVMAPAALHRQTEPHAVSRRFIDLSSRLLMGSMAPLVIGICLDVYIIARVLAGSVGWAASLAAGLMAVFALFWVVLPRVVRRNQ
jgi:membrane associated rhomboid family serine protease